MAKRRKKVISKRVRRKKVKKREEPRLGTCGLCGTANTPIAYTDQDYDLDLPDGEDYHDCDVCYDCMKAATKRSRLVCRVLDAVRARLGNKTGAEEKVASLESLIDPFDHAPTKRADSALKKWAKKLGVAA